MHRRRVSSRRSAQPRSSTCSHRHTSHGTVKRPWGGEPCPLHLRDLRDLRARWLAVIIPPNGELQPTLLHPSTAPPSPTSWLGANLAYSLLISASLGRGLKMPSSSTSFCSIICVAVQKFSACGGHAENTGGATPRGSASCADPRGVLLPYSKAPCCKDELFAHRRKRSLQLHVMLLPHTAQLSNLLLRLLIVQLAAAACCCWH